MCCIIWFRLLRAFRPLSFLYFLDGQTGDVSLFSFSLAIPVLTEHI
jgi:hypothetical protein